MQEECTRLLMRARATTTATTQYAETTISGIRFIYLETPARISCGVFDKDDRVVGCLLSLRVEYTNPSISALSISIFRHIQNMCLCADVFNAFTDSRVRQHLARVSENGRKERQIILGCFNGF